MWDGTSAASGRAPVHVRIEAGRIAAIGADEALRRDARVIEPGPDAVALPGLIDAHVHLTLSPERRTPQEQLAVPEAQVRTEMEARARAMLRAGITTARDLGGGAWLELDLRDRIAQGQVPGPRLLCAGQPLTVPSGHCFYWGGAANGEDEIRGTVQRQVEHDADWIKVMATGGVNTRGTRPVDAQFSAYELSCARDEAERHGRPLAAHCHGTAGIRNAVQARVASIEHCSFAGPRGFGSDFAPDVLPDMVRRDLWVSPTVNSGWARSLEREDGGPGRFFTAMQRVLQALREAGVPLVASTDAGIPNVFHDDLPRALRVFQAYTGMSNAELLRTATSDAARALGLAGETGRLAPGLAADVLVVRGDPLEDPSALAEPLLVTARGAVVSPE